MLRPFTAFKLSLRLPPRVDGYQASLHLKTRLTAAVAQVIAACP